MLKQFALGIWLVVMSCGTAWSYELEVLDLQHRSADEVLPVIRPLLREDESISGMNYQIILRAAPQTVTQVRRLLLSLDRAPRRLQVSVIQDVDRETVQRINQLSGSLGVGNARIAVSGRHEEEGANIALRQGDNRLQLQMEQENQVLREHKLQQLQIIEGGRGLVNVGQAVPVPQYQVIQRPWGREVITQTQFQEAGSGFYVSPRVNGETVMVDISTRNDELESGRYPREQIQRATTTLSGRLGEWIELGGVSQQRQQQDSDIGGSRDEHSNEQRSIYLKVEEIQP